MSGQRSRARPAPGPSKDADLRFPRIARGLVVTFLALFIGVSLIGMALQLVPR